MDDDGAALDRAMCELLGVRSWRGLVLVSLAWRAVLDSDPGRAVPVSGITSGRRKAHHSHATLEASRSRWTMYYSRLFQCLGRAADGARHSASGAAMLAEVSGLVCFATYRMQNGFWEQVVGRTRSSS